MSEYASTEDQSEIDDHASDSENGFADVNWFAEFFAPGGKSSQPIFLRGQTYLIFFRVLVFVVCLVLANMMPAIAIMIWLICMTPQLFMSIVLHIRRLADAGRSALWALIVALPLFLSSLVLVPTVSSVPAEMVKIEAKKADMEAERKERREEKKRAAAEPEKTEEETSEADDETADADKAPEAQNSGRGRRGPPVEVTQSSLLAQALSQSMYMWLLLSFITTLFSFIGVARFKRKDPDQLVN